MPSKPSRTRRLKLVPHIRYVSPYGGHPILRRKGADAYAAVVSFLHHCTDWDGRWPENTIQCPAPDDFIRRDERSSKIIAEFERAFGDAHPGITSQVVELGSSMTVLSSTTAENWAVPEKMHDWAVKRVLEAPPAQRGWPDAISCSCCLDFRLRDPTSRRILAGQSAKGNPYEEGRIRSGLLMHVSSGNTSAFFDLVLPFEKPDTDFVAYIAKIHPYLPIRLAKGNFKHCVLKKRGDGLVLRRIDASLLADI